MLTWPHLTKSAELGGAALARPPLCVYRRAVGAANDNITEAFVRRAHSRRQQLPQSLALGVIVHRGSAPFAGAGEPLRCWSMAIPLRPKNTSLPGLRPARASVTPTGGEVAPQHRLTIE